MLYKLLYRNGANMPVTYLFGHKISCDGHVIKRPYVFCNSLVNSVFLCGGYVITPQIVPYE
jgi:hypothetical protein